MKTMAFWIAIAATGLGAAIGTNAESQHSIRQPAVIPGCIVPVAVAPGYLHRAILTVENRGSQQIRIRVEGRIGSALPAAELGTVGAHARQSFVHALPAGRNELTAVSSQGAVSRQLFYVTNHGAQTCARRYVWLVE